MYIIYITVGGYSVLLKQHGENLGVYCLTHLHGEGKTYVHTLYTCILSLTDTHSVWWQAGGRESVTWPSR